MTDIQTTDDELEALMAELEAENAKMLSEQDKTVSQSSEAASVPAFEPAASDEQESVPTTKPEVVRQDENISADAVPPVVENAGLEQEAAPLQAAEADATNHSLSVEDGVAEAPEPVAAKPKKPRAVSDVLNFYVDVKEFAAKMAISEVNIDSCMFEQASLRAYYGQQAAMAEAQASRMKAKFETIEASLYDEHRKAFAASGEKTTEKMVENAVKMDRRWLSAKNLVIEAESIASINKNLVMSLSDRKDMLIQIGADRREEMKGALRITEKEELSARAGAIGQRFIGGKSA